ncbi:MAG: hypothetical protein VW715_06365 [Rhodospirillales bacterium]
MVMGITGYGPGSVGSGTGAINIDEALGADLMQDLAPFMPGTPAGTGASAGGAFGGLFDTLTGSDLIQTGLSAAALQDQMRRLSDIGTGLATGARELGEEAQAGTAFRPFTVSTGFGGITTTPTGGYTTTLSPAMAAQQQALQGITSGLLGGMGGMEPPRIAGGMQAPRAPYDLTAAERTGFSGLGPTPRPIGQLQGSSGPRPPSLQEVLAGRGFTMPEKPTGISHQAMVGFKDPVTGDFRFGGAHDASHASLLSDFYGQNPEALELAKQYQADPFQFGGKPSPIGSIGSKLGQMIQPSGGLIGELQPAQPSQAPTAPATGGFGAGIPDVSGITGQALGGVGGFLTGAMAPMAQREAEVYERIRATQRPEEQRKQLALEERLAAQGRTGLRTAQFGGSPEQLALAQAQEEAKARASLAAIQQAQAEQLQQAGLAESMFGLGGRAAALPASLQLGQLQNIGLAQAAQYLPEQQLLASLTPAISLADIAGTGQRQGAGYLAQAGTTGLEALGQTEIARANLLRDLYSGLLAQQTNAQTGERQESVAGGLFGDLLAGIGNIFTG